MDVSLLAHMARVCGDVPDPWKEYFAANINVKKAFLPEGAHFLSLYFLSYTNKGAEYTPEQADKFWAGRLSEKCIENWPSFVRLLRRMLIIDPEQRPSAEELLRDPYFDGMQDVTVGV
jgi:serine/threonine protein kinase